MGDPRLLEAAQPIAEFDTPALHALVQDLHDTSAALHGAGLAAACVAMVRQNSGCTLYLLMKGMKQWLLLQ
jgi:peptide deformylase